MGVDLAETPIKIREAERTDFKVRLHKEDLPWLPDNHHEVHLVRMRIGSGQFLFGSAIKGRPLVEAAQQLDEHRSEIANNLLYTHLPQFAEGYNPHVKIVENTKTRQPIFYIGNKGGQRVYFMRFGKIENMPVIVKIAVCDKARQLGVLEEITTDSRKRLKSIGVE